MSTINPEPMDLEILYEDEDIAVINKPSGMIVHPGKGNTSKTLQMNCTSIQSFI